jgi:hypothetical protein
LSEVVALRLLRELIKVSPQDAGAICDGVIADLKAAVGEYVAIGKGGRDPKAMRAAEAMDKKLAAMITELEAQALKPKA